jgi:ABC-type glutathione transport system ATPase component
MNSASSNEPLRLTDSKQSDVKPAESKPDGSKPSDSKPVSSKPSDDMPAQQTPLEDTPAVVKSSKSTRWNVESDTAISHPIINEETKKLPKILIWKDLFVSVPIQVSGGWIKKRSKKTRIVLKGVSGVAEPGEILAIMGESGMSLLFLFLINVI